MAFNWFSALFTPRDEPAYHDEQGRPRTAGGFLIDKESGDPDFRQDFTHQPGWEIRNAPWWNAYGLRAGEVYDCDRAGNFETYAKKYNGSVYYTTFAGEPVPDYVGPYFSRNAVRYLARRRITVPEWAQMRAASHSDQRIQYPGYGGSTPEGYGGTFSWRKDYKPAKRSAR